MKLLTVIFPAYTAPAYEGATPQPHKQRAVGKLEHGLLKESKLVLRERSGLEQVYYGAGGHLDARLVMRYIVQVDDLVSASDIALLVHETLGVKIEDIIMGGDDE